MALKLAVNALTGHVYEALYMRVVGLQIDYSRKTAVISVECHKDEAARRSGALPVAGERFEVSPNGMPPRPAMAAQKGETGVVLRPATPEFRGVPAFDDVFGERRGPGNELQIAYAYLRLCQGVEGAIDA